MSSNPFEQSVLFSHRSATHLMPSNRATARQKAHRHHDNTADDPRTAELLEDDSMVRLTVDLPGIQSKHLEVHVNHGVLTVDAVRRTMSVDGSFCVKRCKISKRYAIDTDVVDVAQLKANLACGVLTIKAPKKSRPQRVRVDVTENEEEELMDSEMEEGIVEASDVRVTTTNDSNNGDASAMAERNHGPVSELAADAMLHLGSTLPVKQKLPRERRKAVGGK